MNFLRSYEVWIFLILVPITSWFFMKGIDTGAIPMGMFSHGRFVLLALLLIAVVGLSRGASGILELVRPLLNWNVPFKWYIFCALWSGFHEH